MSHLIAVEELRVGMFIQLDGGWLSHPFPLSSFRISGLEQIAALRGLGLERVLWWPEKSDPAVGGPADAAPPADATPHAKAEVSAERRWIDAQREAAQRCERQYAEAGKAWREACDNAGARPVEAGRTVAALTQAMLDKMLAAEEVGIRLVSGGGDRAAAHALNVSVVSLLMGRALGLAGSELLELGLGALLHDVGKQDVADRFRHLEDGFNAAEQQAYRDHVPKGLAQGQRMQLPAGAMAVLAQHHENADGSGFPQRLVADRMALGARIVAIVNRYDNLCNPASRVQALTPHEAVAMLFAQGRSRFDTVVLNAFIRLMGVYPAGSLVQLTDDRYALVVGVNSSRPLKPRVLVHGTPGAAEGDSRPAQLLDLERVLDLGIRRSLAATRLPPRVLQALDPRPRVAYFFEPLPATSAQASAQALAA